MFLRTCVVGVLILPIVFGGCGRQMAARAHAQELHEQQDSQEEQDLQGIASWYGHPFHGRLTASGQIYDMEKLTAAHRTLPFGTVLRVERLDSHKTVEITVNDRGPFVKDRIIDLSHAAAQTIDMQGTSEVKLSVLYRPKARGPETYALQIGDFATRVQAQQARQRLGTSYGAVRIIPREGDNSWRVLVGEEPTEALAGTLAQRIPKQADPVFVVLVDND